MEYDHVAETKMVGHYQHQNISRLSTKDFRGVIVHIISIQTVLLCINKYLLES